MPLIRRRPMGRAPLARRARPAIAVSPARQSNASPVARPLLALAALWPLLLPPVSSARAPGQRPPAGRVPEFAGWYHSAGNLLLHVSNWGMFGRNGGDITNPSAEWPAGSDHEYLFAAALWVGGVVRRGAALDTLVTTGRFGQFGEFNNLERDEGCGSPIEGICATFEGAPNGQRRFDDDGDGQTDEDPLDGEDNDGDGRIDEDFGAVSQEMFRAVTYDTSTAENQFNPDRAEHHVPLGLAVTQESYQWTDPNFDDFVGVEYTIRNISEVIDGVGWTIEKAYIGFMVDADVGRDDPDLDVSNDDQVAFTTLDTVIETPVGDPRPVSLTMGYMYDEPGLEGDDVPGFLGGLFLGHTVDTTTVDDELALAPREVGIHAFTTFARGANDPRNDLERYRLLRGLSDVAPTINPNSTRATDYRFLISAGPFARIPPGSTLTFQVAFVCGDMVESVNPETGAVTRVPDMTNPVYAQLVYDGQVDEGEIVHWSTSAPPPPPNQRLVPGDRAVTIEWDDFSEHTPDPFTRELDFAGYQVWKAEGWIRESNIPSADMWRLIADYDTTELSRIDTGGTGVGKYRIVDTRVQNGFWYWYAVTAYDRGIFRRVIVQSSPPETTYVRDSAPKFGKYSQTMQRIMPRTTPAATLDDVWVVPNPYKESAAWDLLESPGEPTGRRVKFFNLPERATIRIFTASGDHVVTLEHDARTATEAGQLHWNLISKNGQDTVSGIYIWQVSTPDGQRKVDKLVVIR